LTEITVGLGRVLVIDNAGPHDELGWQLSGGNWMVTQCDLPADWPPLARAACELLRAMTEFTPQQAACAKAAIEELMT